MRSNCERIEKFEAALADPEEGRSCAERDKYNVSVMTMLEVHADVVHACINTYSVRLSREELFICV